MLARLFPLNPFIIHYKRASVRSKERKFKKLIKKELIFI